MIFSRGDSMKLDVEIWAENHLDKNSIELINEAVMCYKIGAYKSAYLMSYLAFKVTIRENILKCDYVPIDVDEKEWNDEIKVKLSNENKWEGYLNKIVLCQIEGDEKKFISNIFKYKKPIETITNYNYFKQIRNSCAHAKQETINASTVEQLWNYMHDNISQFRVLGGEEYLVKELSSAYNYRMTNDSKKILITIIDDINVVYKDKAYVCIEEALQDEQIINKTENDKEFWGTMINSEHQNIRVGICKFLMKKTYNFVQIHESFPKLLKYASTIEEKFITDKIQVYFKEPFIRNMSYEYYWNLFFECLSVYNNYLDIDEICKFCLSPGNVTLNKNQISKFKEYDLFNKILLLQHQNFFKCSWQDIKDNKYSYTEDNAMACFKFINWNRNIISDLSYSIYILNQRKGHPSYGRWEKERENKYLEILKANENKIKMVIDEEAGKEDGYDFSSILEIYNREDH